MIMSASLAQWMAHALGFGLLATVACGIVLITVQFLAPYAFLSDYPEDIREAAPEPTPTQKHAGTIGGIVFVIALIGGVAAWSGRGVAVGCQAPRGRVCRAGTHGSARQHAVRDVRHSCH